MLRNNDYRATLTVMVALALTTLTGFLREATLAYQLGAGRSADIFLVAFAVPEFVFVALPIILLPAFIPLFADCRLKLGETSAWRFGLRTAMALVGVLLLFTALAGLGAPLYVIWLAPSFTPSEHAQVVQATNLILPSISLMGLGTLVGAALQVYRRFARTVLATALYNLVFMASLWIMPLVWPVGRAAWGVTLGAAAALALQAPRLWRYRPDELHLSGTEQSAEFSVGHLARLAGPLTAGYLVHHLILFVDRAMATTLGPGSAAVINYAYHLALVVGQLSGLAVATAIFPGLSEQIARGDTAGVRASLSQALRFVWITALPATAGLIVLRTPVVKVLFERGAFDPAATAAVSAPLIWYAVSVLADSVCLVLWRVIYARRSAWIVVGINGLQTGVRLLGNLVFISRFGPTGLALSATVGLLVQMLVLGGYVWRSLGSYLNRIWWTEATCVIVATGLAAGVASWLSTQLSAMSPEIVLGAASTLGCSVYVAVLLVLKYLRSRSQHGIKSN